MRKACNLRNDTPRISKILSLELWFDAGAEPPKSKGVELVKEELMNALGGARSEVGSVYVNGIRNIKLDRGAALLIRNQLTKVNTGEYYPVAITKTSIISDVARLARACCNIFIRRDFKSVGVDRAMIHQLWVPKAK